MDPALHWGSGIHLHRLLHVDIAGILDIARSRSSKGSFMVRSVRCISVSRARHVLSGLGVIAGALFVAAPASAQTTPTVTVGAGMRTSITHTAPDGGDDSDKVALDSARIYLGGKVTDNTNFMFNTEYNGADNAVGILDAAAQFAFSEKFNIWAGRFLPPSDRANLYGPFYANHWAVYTDGVQDGYPFIFQGRDNGVMYWGQFDKVKVSAGAFDGASATGSDNLLAAGRVQVDLWDPEAGYYLNGTYYGAKDLLAIGVAGQVQDGEGSLDTKSAFNVDFLLEKKVPGGGAFTIEAEYAKYDKLGGYNGRYAESDGGYVLAAYLFPQMVGSGRFQVLGKFAAAKFEEGLTIVDPDYTQKTTEINLNYIIKEFNSRVMMFFKNTDFDAVGTNNKQFGVGLQIQM